MFYSTFGLRFNIYAWYFLTLDNTNACVCGFFVCLVISKSVTLSVCNDLDYYELESCPTEDPPKGEQHYATHNHIPGVYLHNPRAWNVLHYLCWNKTNILNIFGARKSLPLLFAIISIKTTIFKVTTASIKTLICYWRPKAIHAPNVHVPICLPHFLSDSHKYVWPCYCSQLPQQTAAGWSHWKDTTCLAMTRRSWKTWILMIVRRYVKMRQHLIVLGLITWPPPGHVISMLSTDIHTYSVSALSGSTSSATAVVGYCAISIHITMVQLNTKCENIKILNFEI